MARARAVAVAVVVAVMMAVVGTAAVVARVVGRALEWWRGRWSFKGGGVVRAVVVVRADAV